MSMTRRQFVNRGLVGGVVCCLPVLFTLAGKSQTANTGVAGSAANGVDIRVNSETNVIVLT